MEANNDILADKPIETHIEKSILDEPDPPDKEMDGIEIDAEEERHDEPMEISKETDKPAKKTAEKNPNIEEVKLGKRPFEFDHPLKGYGGEKRSGVEMVIPQEVREIINQLQKKVDQIEKNRMKDTEETKKYRDQTNEKN